MNYHKILEYIDNELKPYHFESYPFKVEWYNENVDSKYKLNYENDTLAVLLLNTPRMFENLFLPYLYKNFKDNESELDNLNDPIDKCLKIKFDEVKQKTEEILKINDIENVEIDAIKDYEISPGSRKARIIMQTCAHVSGAACYYDSKSVDTSKIKKGLMGVCLHPSYGGWFALRCVYIFKNFQVNELTKKVAIDPLNGDMAKTIDTLHKFNYNWKDSTYRDTIPVIDKYSDIQQEYFSTEPKCRRELIKKWLKFRDEKDLIQNYENKSLYKNFYKNYMINNFFLV